MFHARVEEISSSSSYRYSSIKANMSPFEFHASIVSVVGQPTIVANMCLNDQARWMSIKPKIYLAGGTEEEDIG